MCFSVMDVSAVQPADFSTYAIWLQSHDVVINTESGTGSCGPFHCDGAKTSASLKYCSSAKKRAQLCVLLELFVLQNVILHCLKGGKK